MAVYDERDYAVPLSERAGVFLNYAGAAVSLALMAGIGVWGYQLIKRDVSGIPVVQAIEGAMRVSPDNPGGELEVHTGLAVNEVAAAGAAAAPEDSVLLAPNGSGLAAEDLEIQPSAEAGEVVPQGIAGGETQVVQSEVIPAAPDKPLTAEEILALAEQITAGTAPLERTQDSAIAPTVALDGEPVLAIERLPASVPGVATSLRPIVRPASLNVTPAAPEPVADTATAVAAALTEVVSSTSVPSGTSLVQLGAFSSAEEAVREWDRLQGRFGDFMGTKSRLIQEASASGTTFYRLRASGFEAHTDAERFCAAVKAGNAECVAVLVR